MIQVKFIKDAIWPANGKLIPAGKVIVLDTEHADAYIASGHAQPIVAGQQLPAELVQMAEKPLRKKTLNRN